MRICIGLLVIGLAGCGASTGDVSGRVSYDGKPIEDGYITFFPKDEKGKTDASPIKNGAYQVSGLVPGPRVVEVVASKKINFAMSSEEMEAKFKAAKAKGDATGIIEPADLVPANAIGNRQTVEIKAGSQTLDIQLKKP